MRMEDLHIGRDGAVGIVEMRRPPHNFFDLGLVSRMADACEAFSADPDCRAIVLQAAGKSFSAGVDLSQGLPPGAAAHPARHTYREALRLMRSSKPIVAAVHGAAIGGGLGLALVADFRVGCPLTRLAANFTRLGFHPGFGLTATLPRLVGSQAASRLFLTARTLEGEAAYAMGLLDELVPPQQVQEAALALARELAEVAPLALQSTRQTMRRELLPAFEAAIEREMAEQAWLGRTQDFQEGLAAARERRPAQFRGG